MAPDARFAPIYNACWWVRRYALQRTPAMRAARVEAIRRLGLLLREAFNATDDFEPLLVAIVDGLRPRDDPPF